MESLRESLERYQGLHTTYIQDGVLVCECEHTDEIGEIETQIRSADVSPPGTLRDESGSSQPVHIIYKPRYEIQILRAENYPVAESAESTTEHRRCHNIPKGGCQIAPQGAGWVGTLGGRCSFRDGGDDKYAGITNWHVAFGGEFPIGHNQCQPHGSSNPFGRLAAYESIKFDNSDNLMDVAFIDCEMWMNGNRWDTNRNDTRGKHFISGEMIGWGPLAATANRDPKRGLKLRKTGRTTGVLTGQVMQTGATSYVSYGGGKVGKFVNQLIIRNPGGADFSAGGDSGSLIMDEQNRPVALLFAGGGADTIASPIGPIIDRFKLSFDLG